MEARQLHVGLLWLLLSGWLVLDGCSLWLTLQWADLGRGAKLLIGWFPIIVTNGLWALFWRYGSYRAAHVMLLLGSVSLPLGVGVLLNAMQWLELTLQDPSLVIDPLTNAQELTAFLTVTVWTALLG